MLKRIVILLLAAIFVINPILVSAEPTKEEKEAAMKELAKDLAEFHELIILWQRSMEKLTPEERKQWCIHMQEEMKKNPPPIPLLFNCD